MNRLDIVTADNATPPHVKVIDGDTTICEVPIGTNVKAAECQAARIIAALRIMGTLSRLTPYRLEEHPDTPADAIAPDGDDAMESLNGLIDDARECMEESYEGR